MGDMGDIGDSIRPENSLSPSLSRSGEPETGHMQPHITGQRGNLADRDHSNDSNDTYDSIAASSFTDGLETNATSGDCEKMVEKWRLIRRADKLRPRKKVTDATFAVFDQRLTSSCRSTPLMACILHCLVKITPVSLTPLSRVSEPLRLLGLLPLAYRPNVQLQRLSRRPRGEDETTMFSFNVQITRRLLPPRIHNQLSQLLKPPWGRSQTRSHHLQV